MRHVVPVEFSEHINATSGQAPTSFEESSRAPSHLLSFIKTHAPA